MRTLLLDLAHLSSFPDFLTIKHNLTLTPSCQANYPSYSRSHLPLLRCASSQRVLELQKNASVAATSPAAAASGKCSAQAADNNNESIRSMEDPFTQFNGHNNLLYTKNNPHLAAAKRPALDSNEIAVITTSKTTRNTKVFVKDLCDLACNDNSWLNNLCNYILDKAANSSNNSSSNLALSQSNSSNNNDKLLGPIFCSWCNCSTMNNKFVKSATIFLISEFCILYFQTANIIQSK